MADATRVQGVGGPNDGVGNLWRMPIGGGTPRQLTTLTAGSGSEFTWTTDATRLFYTVSETVSRDVLVIKKFR